MSIEIKLAESKEDYAKCVYVRTLVFTVGQQCPVNIEIDEHEDTAHHYVLLNDDEPIAAARWRSYGEGIAKVERIAVLDNHQGKGYGRQIVQYITDELHANAAINKVVMHAQDHALPFYEKIGYQIEGEGFIEANIPHHKIVKEVA